MNSAREITTALKGRWHGRYGMVCCPAHKDRTPSCKVTDGDKRPIFHCFAGCHWKDVVNAVEDMGLLPKWKPARESCPTTQKKNDEPDFTRWHPDVAKKRGWAFEIWQKTSGIKNTLGERYFQSRGITISLPSCIRFHPGLKDKETGRVWPAIVIGYLSYHGDFDGIQRILIDPQTAGKAPVKAPKLSLGTFPGGMMRFANISIPANHNPFFGEVGITEGPEDGLSVMQMFDVPVWAAGAGEKMALADLPPLLDGLFIYADNGTQGKRLAKKALSAHVGNVRSRDGIPAASIIYPEPEYDDFNSQLQKIGVVS